MTEISIKNFQSIKSASFKIDGFTVIVGKNNIGKSALMRAIEAALTNQVGNKFIREGEKNTEVTIKKDDFNLRWKKGTSATYKINDQDYSKLNRDIPQPLKDAGFDKMEISDQKFFPIVASQFEPLFLIDKNGSTITEVLAHLYKIDTISKADDLCQKSIRSQKSLLKTRENDLKDLEKKLEKYKDIKILKKLVEEIQVKNSICKRTEEDINNLIRFEKEFKELKHLINKLKNIKNIKIPDIKRPEKNLELLLWLKESSSELEQINISLNKLKKVKKIDIPKFFELEKQFKDLSYIIKWNDIVKKSKNELDSIKKFLNQSNIDKINTLFSALKTSFSYYQDLNSIEKIFKEIVTKAKEGRESLRDISERLENKEIEMKKFKICPTCERPL